MSETRPPRHWGEPQEHWAQFRYHWLEKEEPSVLPVVAEWVGASEGWLLPGLKIMLTPRAAWEQGWRYKSIVWATVQSEEDVTKRVEEGVRERIRVLASAVKKFAPDLAAELCARHAAATAVGALLAALREERDEQEH